MSDFSYQVLQKAMDAASLRQETISNNIANVNTPGYKVDRVEFEDKLKEAISKNNLDLAKTNEKQVNLVDSLEPSVVKRTNTSVKDNGNNVDIDLEMSEKAANEIYYSALTSQLNARYSMLNYVLNN